MNTPGAFAVLCAALLLSAPAFSHGDGTGHHEGPVATEQKPWGIAGDARHARVIAVRMGDDMRFEPDRITVREGETVRFVLSNRGQLLHEMVIGTPESLQEHAAQMKQLPGMQHDEPSMAHVQPDAQGEIVWTFNRPGSFAFACLLPGHFEAGMTGTVVVLPKAKKS
jgi:uncharacterized cupredoxin-like copper-binding protein